MNKIVKIAGKTLAVLIGLFIVTAIVVPVVFKPQLMRLAKNELNSMLNAQVDFTDFQVSLIKGFPNLYIGMKGLNVIGVDSFKNDTLVAFKEFSVKVNLWSVIDMENFEVKSILLDGAIVRAKVSHDGKANWDVMKPSETPETEVEDTADLTPINTRVSLRKFEIRNANISYIDDSSNMKANIKNFNLILSGNMGVKQTNLNLKSSIESLNFWMDGIRYIKNSTLGFDALIEANLDSSYYTFKENRFSINQLMLLFDGSIRMPNNSIDINLNFKTPSTNFKALLSMIPAIYIKDFEGLQASGNFGIEGYVRGTYNDTQLPNAFIVLSVDNGMFKYPDLPKSISNVNISTKAWFDGTHMDNSLVNVDRFSLELGGNPFSMNLHVATPISDMLVNGNVTGKIDFASLTDIVPLDSTFIEGILESNLDFGGKLSFIEKEQYDRFKADGMLKLSRFKFKSPDLPAEVAINDITLNFSPQYVNLANFDMNIGSSDVHMKGLLENFIPYIFSNATLSGNLEVHSNLFNTNELMTGDSTPNEETTDSTVLSVIEIPKNINFVTKVDFKKIVYDKLIISNTTGNVTISDRVADLKNLSMNMLEGSVQMSGTYDPRDPKVPRVNFDFNMRDIEIPAAFKSFSTLQKMAPAVKDMTGRVSTQFRFTSLLDTTMMPVMSSIDAYGKLQSYSIGISNSKAFAKLADFTKKEELRNPSLKDVNVSFSVRDERIYIEPFDTKIVQAKMNFGGDMGIDQTLNFKAKVAIPTSYLGGATNLANDLLGKYGAKLPQNLDIKIKILGTSSKPEVILDSGMGSESASSSVKETAREVVKGKIDDAKVEARQKAKAESDRLIADAEREAERIRAEAAKQAEQIRKEAEAQAQKTEAEGKKKGSIAEKIAKEAAKKIRQNGEAAAQKVISEADEKANALVAKAKAEAAKLEQ